MTTDVVVADKEPTVHLDHSDDSTTESCDEKGEKTSGIKAQSGFGGAACEVAGLDTNSTPSCAHLKKCVDFNSIKKTLKTVGLENKTCQECVREPSSTGPTNSAVDLLMPNEEDGSLWMCLKCGVQLCRQGSNQSSSTESSQGAMHALQHFQKPRSEVHAMFVNTTTFNVWCFQCKQFVDSAHRKKLMEVIDFLKKDAKKVTTNSRQQAQPAASPTATTATLEDQSQSTASATAVAQKKCTPNTLSLGGEHGSKSTLSPMTGNYSLAKPRPLNLISLDSLPRVRGLSNLGNTCFFNAVLQCLAQTPYLSSVLKESSDAGEYFELPGGTLQLNDKDPKDTADLPPINGNLVAWSKLTSTLSETIDELGSGSGSVHNPRKLLNELTNKWPQFGDGDQHDSHELLRHLLESVRNEDLRRYQTLILHALGYNKKVDPQKVQGDVKKKIKFYGQQASDRILRPEQVFRGFLVSTLMCQECHHTSSRHENFLDISLPVSQDKPQPPVRRKGSPEPANSLIALPMANEDTFAQSPASSSNTSKHQLKKERKKEKKMKRITRKQKLDRNVNVDGAGGDVVDAERDEDGSKKPEECNASSLGGDNTEEGAQGGPEEQEAGEEEEEVSDDSEDDTDADEEDNCQDEEAAKMSNGVGEKQDDTPENPNKGDFDAKNLVVEVGISESGATNLVQSIDTPLVNGKPADQMRRPTNAQRQRTVSHSDWSTTISPRYQCDEGECSVQSCLNNFTAIELMTGNNKVGCEACTERINGKDGKSVNTNATKQFLISSPPAVLILHLKRFQMGARFMFRKLTRHVTFPFLLDIAPFCGTKVKRLPNVDRTQKKLLYSLYGIVEHSGGMHGGHYVAYVKVRPEMPPDDIRLKFIPQGSKAELDQADEQRVRIEEALAKARQQMANDSDDALSQSSEELNGEEAEGAGGGAKEGGDKGDVDKEADKVVPPPGKWYYVSDSRVTEVSEDAVLKAQAYLLFYERIY